MNRTILVRATGTLHRKRLAGLFLIGVIFSVGGCGKSKSRIVVAQDGSCQVVLPSGWVERKVNETAVLKAGVASETALFMVLRFPKEDLAADETYQGQGRTYMDQLRAAEDFETVTIDRGPTDHMVNGRPAVQYEVEVVNKKDRSKFRFLITVVDGEKSFFRLVGTLLPSEVVKHRGAVEEVTNSFTEVK